MNCFKNIFGPNKDISTTTETAHCWCCENKFSQQSSESSKKPLKMECSLCKVIYLKSSILRNFTLLLMLQKSFSIKYLTWDCSYYQDQKNYVNNVSNLTISYNKLKQPYFAKIVDWMFFHVKYLHNCICKNIKLQLAGMTGTPASKQKKWDKETRHVSEFIMENGHRLSSRTITRKHFMTSLQEEVIPSLLNYVPSCLACLDFYAP